MKKTLLGTTALVTAGLLAGPALASDPLKVTVGGNVVTGFYVIDQDNVGGTSFQDTKVAVVARNIDIKAEGTLDNGLVAGVDAKMMLGTDFGNDFLANDSGDVTFRQLFAYLEGGFGRFEIGGVDGAAYKMHYTSPWFVPGNGVDTANILNLATFGISSYYGLRHSTFSLLATDENKISYFTPRLAGFQLGLSFTPTVNDNLLNQRNVTANGLGLLPDNADVDEVFEVALNYAGSFGGVDVGLDGFYTTGDGPAVNSDPEEYGFGANLGYMGFTLGGAYYESNDIVGPFTAFPGAANAENTTWTAGLQYATGPWKVGVAYLNGEQDLGALTDEVQTWQFGGGYNLGAGVDIGLDIQFSNLDSDDSDLGTIGLQPLDKDSKSAGIVLAVAF